MRRFQHVPHGALAAVLIGTPETQSLGWAFLLSFWGYEVYQGIRTRDMGFVDVRSALWGLGIGAAIIWLVRMFA